MDKERVRAAVTVLSMRSVPISVHMVHALIGGSFRDVTKHLRQLRAEGGLGGTSAAASPGADPWRSLPLEEVRQVARSIVQGAARVYIDDTEELGYVVGDEATPAPAWRGVNRLEARLVAHFLRTGQVSAFQQRSAPGLYRVVL